MTGITIERGLAVSAERIRELREQAVTFEEFLEGNPSRELFEESYRNARPAAAEIEEVGRAAREGDLSVLAVVEHWCPDVVASLPFVQRLSEEGAVPVRIVVRGPETQDVANVFQKAGGGRIPTYIVTGESGETRGALVERTEYAEEVIAALQQDFGREHGITVDEDPFLAKLADDQRTAYVAELRERRRVHAQEEHRSIAAELAALLRSSTEA